MTLGVARKWRVFGHKRRLTIFSKPLLHNIVPARCTRETAGSTAQTVSAAIQGAVITFFDSFAAVIAAGAGAQRGRMPGNKAAGIRVTVGSGICQVGFAVFPDERFDDAITAFPSFNSAAAVTAVIVPGVAVVTFFAAFAGAISTNVHAGIWGRRRV